MPRPSPSLALAACLPLALAACGGAAEWDYEPASGTLVQLGTRAGALAELDAELARLFGTPFEPRYLVPPEWAAVGFDPNAPGGGELSAAVRDAVARDNARRFADLLDAVENGSVAEASAPSSPEGLRAAFDAVHAAAPDEATARAELADLVLGWHSDLPRGARVYRAQCLTCHGREGGGDGPTSNYLNPRPRDLRSGEFLRFDAESREKPRQEDLLLVLRDGIPGSGMPTFGSRPAGELSGVVDYVRLLSLRGEVERALARHLGRGGALDEATVLGAYSTAWRRWRPELPALGAAAEDAGGAE